MLSFGALALGRAVSAQGVLPVVPDAEVALVEDSDSFMPVTIEGFVLDPDGAPAEGAVVVSSAGGKAVTDWNGSFRLEAWVALDAQSIQITAVGRAGQNQVASEKVDLSAASGLARVGPVQLAQTGTCQPSWLPTFPGTVGSVYALTVFDDGNGPALYAGGDFTIAVGATGLRNGIAKWDGSSWTGLGSGVRGYYPRVYALTVYDDGGGPALYAGGCFTSAGGVAATTYIAKWDGSSWAALGSGMNYAVSALTVYDDGSGPALYAGGQFRYAGGVAASFIAKWDGSSWFALGTGMDLYVNALTVYDDGSGPALYAGGYFTSAGGVAASRVARWDGSNWTALGGGVGEGRLNPVFALTVYDDGSGPALYVGGTFLFAGGVLANGIAKWDGSSWAALGSGVAGGFTPTVSALTIYDDGSGSALYAGGSFWSAGGVAVNGIAKWDGSSWAALGSGIISDLGLRALTVYDDGSGPALCAGGGSSIAKWDGSSWAALTTGMNGNVGALTVYDDGGGSALYAGGSFTSAGGVAALNQIGKWDGSDWEVLGSGMNSSVGALTVYDDGGGSALYAGGTFTIAGGVAANRVARWDGSKWAALGSGMNGSVSALTVYDDGSGSALYAGGAFTIAGGVLASGIAKWDGSSWSRLGHGVESPMRRHSHLGRGSPVGINSPVRVLTLTVYDDGSAPALYAGGEFMLAGRSAASNIARWDGSSWAALGGGMKGSVFALTVYDDGSGLALHAGGSFTIALDSGDCHLAKWGCQ